MPRRTSSSAISLWEAVKGSFSSRGGLSLRLLVCPVGVKLSAFVVGMKLSVVKFRLVVEKGELNVTAE
jgi:hypothetical protein